MGGAGRWFSGTTRLLGSVMVVGEVQVVLSVTSSGRGSGLILFFDICLPTISSVRHHCNPI
jgi:hypothetical protein